MTAAAEGQSLRIVLGVAAGFIIVGGLKLAAPVLAPLAFALFLGILVQPLFQWLLARRVPVFLAVLATMLILGIAIGGVLMIFFGSVGELREVGPTYYKEFQERAAYTVEWWQGKGITILDWMPAKFRRPEAIVEWLSGGVRSLLRLLSSAAIVLLLLLFLLFEAAALPAKLARMPPMVRDGLSRFGHVSRELQRYLLIKTAMSLAIGLASGLWLGVLKVDFAVLCGLVALVCHFIPNIGALLAALPAMFLAFAQYDLMKAIAVGVGYLVIGTLLGNLVEPALLGRRLGMSTLVVFFSLVFWGWLWGAVGMFLSVPLTATVKILLERSDSWRWVATLLDAGRGHSEQPPAPVFADEATRPG